MANDDRYGSAAGWDGLDKETRAEHAKRQKQFDAYKLEHARDLLDESALTVETPGDVFQTAALPAGQLFGDFFREGQLAILFADTGVGKSTLAVQIADAIALGRDAFYRTPLIGLNCFNESAAQKVVYIDFELTKDQFAARYSVGVRDGEYHGIHFFSHDKFLRARIEWEDDVPQGFASMDEFIVHSIGQIMDIHPDVKVLIIDNITYITSSTTSMGRSLRLMKGLKAFKDGYGISILVLAHSPKRHHNGAITVNDLQGSKMLANFADSIFAIGQCAYDPRIRYIKQIKTRTDEMRFHRYNVISCRIVKTRGFLHFVPFALTVEFQHLERRPMIIRTPKPTPNPRSSAKKIITKTAVDHPAASSIANPDKTNDNSNEKPVKRPQRITSATPKDAKHVASQTSHEASFTNLPIPNQAILNEVKRLHSQGTPIHKISRHLLLPEPQVRHCLGEEEVRSQ